ncbi:MAG: nucleotidyl transferase AbiEii/AbiGii toxin family protein, partial [Salinibacterium sp.]|nr:nucleotidyl transferase AbiEii/AbiGii toxin family protein [Salinibacterium sp.]
VAGQVRLFEHDEFEQAILQAARRLGVSEQFVEKDYYVTEILRIVVVEQLDGKAIFKGGTSLSKGWGLINRFSEDIDLFVNRDMFEPRPGGNKMDRILKELSVTVSEHPALTRIPHHSRQVDRTKGDARISFSRSYSFL